MGCLTTVFGMEIGRIYSERKQRLRREELEDEQDKIDDELRKLKRLRENQKSSM